MHKYTKLDTNDWLYCYNMSKTLARNIKTQGLTRTKVTKHASRKRICHKKSYPTVVLYSLGLLCTHRLRDHALPIDILTVSYFDLERH